MTDNLQRPNERTFIYKVLGDGRWSFKNYVILREGVKRDPPPLKIVDFFHAKCKKNVQNSLKKKLFYNKRFLYCHP